MQICNSLIVLLQMVALIDAVHSSFIPEAHPNEKNLEEYLGDSVKRLESKTLQEKSLKGVKPGIEKTGDKKYVITPIPKKKKTMSEDDDLSDPYLVKCLKQESPIKEIEKDMGNPETVRAFLTCEDAKANKTKNMSSENIEEEKARLGVMPPEEIAPSESDMTVTEDGTSKVLIVRIEPEKKKTVDISDISVKTIEEKQTLRERGGLDNSDDTIKRLEQGVKSPDTDKVNVESIKNKNVFGDISLVEPEKKRPLKGPKEEKMMSEDYDSSDPYLVKCLKQESPIVGTENGMGNPSTCEEVKANKTDNMSLEYTEMKNARNGVMPPEEIAPSNSDMTVTENGTSKVLITRIEPDNKKTVEISDISLKPLEEKKTSRKRDAVDDSRGIMPFKYTEEKKARNGVMSPEDIAPSNSDMTVTENGTSKVLITRIEPDNKKTVEISDISLKPLEEKKTSRKRDAVDDSRGNMPLKYTEEKKARDGVIPPEEIALSNSGMPVTENGTSKVLITRIEPDNKKTVEISDISLKPLEEKKTLRKRDAVDDSRGNMPLKYTEEKKARDGVIPPEEIALSNSGMPVTENGTSKVLITRIESDNKKTVEISDISLKPLEKKKTLRKRDAVDDSRGNMPLKYTEEKKARDSVIPSEEIAPSNSDMTVTENGTSKVLITRIEPDKKKTVEISDISLKPLEEKKTLRKRNAVDDSRGNMPLKYTEEKKARDGVIPPEEIAPSNSGMPVTENGTSKVLITRIEPDNKKTVEISDISLKPLEEKKTLRKRDAVDNSDDTVKRLEQGEPNNLLAKVLGIPISSTTETAVVEIANNTEMKPGLESERTVTNQQLLSNTTSSTLDKPTIEVFRMESTTINSKSGNNSDADSRVKIQGTNQLPTDSPKFQIQVDTTISTKEPGKFEEITQMEVTQTEKPTLFGRMKHNRHRKLHSEENEEDKPVGSVPCTCGVFLSGQFKKGSKQQPKGLPVLTQEMDNPFMNNAMGSRQCTNKCLELIIKHLPKSSEIICATVDRENVFKERAYLFIKNHSDKWHGTNLSAGREFCCRDNTPYKCPAS